MKTIFIFLIKAAERRTLSAAAGKIKKEAPGLLWFLSPFYLLFPLRRPRTAAWAFLFYQTARLSFYFLKRCLKK